MYSIALSIIIINANLNNTLIIDNKLPGMYYIFADEEYGIPESFVDFNRIYTISTVMNFSASS